MPSEPCSIQSNIFSVIVIIFIICSCFFWGYSFYHWYKTEFENNQTRKMWFRVIYLGGFLFFIGPLIYYLIVIESNNKNKGKFVK